MYKLWQSYANTKDVSVLKSVMDENPWILDAKWADETLLSCAICAHDATAVSLLLDWGEDPNKPDDGGFPHIIMAVAESKNCPPNITKGIVASLISSGADPNVLGSSGYRPLHWAAHNDQPWLIDTLVDLGADIDGRMNVDGEFTPLMVATKMGSQNAASELKRLGANQRLKSSPNSTNSRGLTASQMVCDKEKT